MKKLLLSLLAIVVVLGLFAAAGYAGYRFGYVQGVQSKATANSAPSSPALRPFGNFNFGFGPRSMPMRRFHSGRDLPRGRGPIRGFGFFPLVASLARALALALIFVLVVGFVFWLFARSGWHLTRQPVEARQPTETPPPTESSASKPENE